MKGFGWRISFVVLYVAAGGAFLWAGVPQGLIGHILPGLAFLVLAGLEGWTILRDRRAGRTGGSWSLTLDLGYIILALCNIYRGIDDPTGFNVGLAVCWSLLGVLYAVKAVRDSRAADKKKEEVS